VEGEAIAGDSADPGHTRPRTFLGFRRTVAAQLLWNHDEGMVNAVRSARDEGRE